MLRYIPAVVFLAFASLLSAQLSLRNADVIKMVKAGLNEDLIITTVNASPGYYDTSVDGLANLKQAGVTDKEFSAIVQKAYHICFAGTDQDQLQGLQLDQMEDLLQKFHCGPHFDRQPAPGVKTAPLADAMPRIPLAMPAFSMRRATLNQSLTATSAALGKRSTTAFSEHKICERTRRYSQFTGGDSSVAARQLHH
ncbi:MAG TPA: hypothetical protein VGG56_02955 [Terracidiphilus sp.]|jgi:hypothetical protein